MGAGDKDKLPVNTSYESARASEWLSARIDAPAVVLPHTVGSVDGTDDLFSLYETMLTTLERGSR